MNKTKLFFVAIISAATLFVACDNATNNNNNEAKDTKAPKSCDNVHWSHKPGTDGPKQWKDLCTDFAACGGEMQSPVNIDKSTVVAEAALALPQFHYGNSTVDVVNNGHTVQFNVNGDNTVELEGKKYKLLQFHYHAKSEHTIDGQYYPLEVHFVHKHSDTDFAVLGIMFVEGKENPLFTKYLNHFPKKKGKFTSDDTIDLLSLFPEQKTFYHYDGSLTTPPCSEVVNWFVLTQPVEASKAQLDAFAAILHSNYRPIMPLGKRKVYMSAGK